MSSSILSSSLIIFLIASFSVSFSAASATSGSSNSSTLIKQVCKTEERHVTIKSKFCIHLLESQPLIVSATNMVDLSTGIIKSGISRAIYMHDYVAEKLRLSADPKLQGALRGCETSYENVIVSFQSALAEAEEKQFQAASYDLSIASADKMRECRDAEESNVIRDETISVGNLVLRTFAFSGDQAVTSLDTSGRIPPRP